MTIENTRETLGAFLRSRRERLVPKDGRADRRRRVPGLRREEVAELAGIGVDWYTRLEQGRAVKPSVATVDALAHALRLTAAEHAHLRALARHAAQPPFERETVPAKIERLVAKLGRPAYVTGRRWDVLAWNAAAARLFDFGRLAEADRNILVFMLLHEDARRVFADGWSSEAQRMVAEFRATHDLWGGDPAFVELVARLRSQCREFRHWWARHEVRGIASGRKTLHLSRRGPTTFEFATFQANDDPALKLVIFLPT